MKAHKLTNADLDGPNARHDPVLTECRAIRTENVLLRLKRNYRHRPEYRALLNVISDEVLGIFQILEPAAREHSE